MSLRIGRMQGVTAKTQAMGAQTFTVDPGHRRHQIAFEPSATPSAGTMAIAVKSPGASAFFTVDTMDLTDTADYLVAIEWHAEQIRCTPALFDAAKTYALYLYSGE